VHLSFSYSLSIGERTNNGLAGHAGPDGPENAGIHADFFTIPKWATARLISAILNKIVGFDLVFLPVLASSCSQLFQIAFNGTLRAKEQVFYGTGNSEMV
jgi:hypothetical protein